MLIFLIFNLISFFLVNSDIITISNGQINGDKIGSFHLFKKIPFAQPPLGNLRFQLPKPAEKWNGVLDAKAYGPACLSNSSITTSPQKWIDEDCLHLNIFTSDKCLASKSCAVVYYIHGGATNYDSAVMFNDTYLLGTFVNQDVILVIPAFRLGIFSHFVVQDQNIAPSNLALHDIMLGMEFVKREISNFGGDNQKVTLLGHSYGGAITSMMTFSTKINQDKSYFQRCISMSSGNEFDLLEFQIEKARNFSRRAGCLLPAELAQKLSQNQQDLYTMKCLQRMDALELLRIQTTMEDEGLPKLQNLILREPLLQEVSYYKFMDTPNRIPMLTGCTRYEMDHEPDYKPVALAIGFQNPKEVDEKYRADWKYGTFDFKNHSDETQVIMAHTKMRVDKLLSNGIPAYLYEYTHPKHAKHTDDLFYIMGVHRFEMDENEQKMGDLYRKMFMNFVKTGEPGEGFEMGRMEDSTYFEVYWDEKTGRRPGMKRGFEKEIMDYWFVDMAAYDKNITAYKNSLKKVPSTRFYSESSSHFQLPYMYMTMIIISMIFLTGCIVGRCFFGGVQRRDLYIRLDGSDNAYHAVKDF